MKERESWINSGGWARCREVSLEDLQLVRRTIVGTASLYDWKDTFLYYTGQCNRTFLHWVSHTHGRQAWVSFLCSLPEGWEGSQEANLKLCKELSGLPYEYWPCDRSCVGQEFTLGCDCVQTVKQLDLMGDYSEDIRAGLASRWRRLWRIYA